MVGQSITILESRRFVISPATNYFAATIGAMPNVVLPDWYCRNTFMIPLTKLQLCESVNDTRRKAAMLVIKRKRLKYYLVKMKNILQLTCN